MSVAYISKQLIEATINYCHQQYGYWMNQYVTHKPPGEIQALEYSNEDYNLFPRYLLWGGIDKRIAFLVGTPFLDLDHGKKEIIKVAAAGKAEVTREFQDNVIGLKAIEEEYHKFKDFLQRLQPEDLQKNDFSPLQYDRRLKPEESKKMRQMIEQIYGFDNASIVDNSFEFYPMGEKRGQECFFIPSEYGKPYEKKIGEALKK